VIFAQVNFAPPQGSSLAPELDALFYYLCGISGFFTLLIAGFIFYFALRYRRRSGQEMAPTVDGSLNLELIWTFFPFLIAMTFFAWGARLYITSSRVPPDAMEIHVVGKQWMWNLQHPTGQREINTLHVPLGRPVKLLMTSEDVIHSFFIPAFRVKQDVLPGRYTTLWFNATAPGEYHLFCAEYCGTLHSGMIGKVHVMQPQDYEAWLSGVDVGEPPVSAGERLFSRLGCITCHGVRGPTLAGLYGSQVKLANGQTVLADENYIRESILNPSAKIVAGFQTVMPTYRGQLTEDQLIQLVTFIKSLQGARQQ